MAACAACLQPILRAQRFVLEGTEAFHAQCAGQSYRSKQRITEQHGFNLERQLNDTRRAAARVEAEAGRMRNEMVSAQAQVAVLEGRLAAEQQRRELLVQAHDARGDELRAARREIAELRAELAAHRVSGPQEDAEVDATALRFKMLELD